MKPNNCSTHHFPREPRIIHADKTNWAEKYSHSSLTLVDPTQLYSHTVREEIRELGQRLVAFSGVNAVRAILPMSSNDHWVEFELQISRNEQNDLELPYEIWDVIRDLVIDYEWQLRDETNEKWYFGVDYFEHFSKISYDSKEVFNSSGSSLNISSKKMATSQSNFQIL